MKRNTHKNTHWEIRWTNKSSCFCRTNASELYKLRSTKMIGTHREWKNNHHHNNIIHRIVCIQFHMGWMFVIIHIFRLFWICLLLLLQLVCECVCECVRAYNVFLVATRHDIEIFRTRFLVFASYSLHICTAHLLILSITKIYTVLFTFLALSCWKQLCASVSNKFCFFFRPILFAIVSLLVS